MNEEQTHLIELLRKAVDKTYHEDRFLLRFSGGDRKGMEQAFVFRVGIYLSQLLRGTQYETLDLDSEYNKNHGNTKTSERFPKGLRPDLIIHRRDSNNENKLVAEFKGRWNKYIKSDIKKLEDLTNSQGNYGYLVGVLVLIGIENAKFRCFINGREYEQLEGI